MLSTAAGTVSWSPLINFIIQNYFMEAIAICIVWNDRVDFQLDAPPAPVISISLSNLNESFGRDVYDFDAKEAEKLIKNNLDYDDITLKLTVAIDHTHCEVFIAFQEDIPIVAHAIHNATIFSLWRSLNTKFLFIYSRDLQQAGEDYFAENLFIDQADILIVEAETLDATVFNLKTNKFVGSLFEHPEELYVLNRYDAIAQEFAWSGSLFPDKLKDLQGREVIVGIMDYRPFSVLDYERQPQTRDHSELNTKGTVHVDGTEVRVLLAFCDIYNCTVEADTTEPVSWGIIFPNSSGDGLLGLIPERKSHYAVGAMFSWYSDYVYLDMSTFLGRSGVTCMVPAPTRQTSWTLPLKPFQFMLWLAVIVCLGLETLALWLSRRYEYLTGNEEHSWQSSFNFGFVSTLMLFVSQGTEYVVNSNTVRTVLFSCYMIDIIITSIYGGGLASILTLPTLGEAADSLERLSKHGIPWTATSTDWIETIIMVEDDPVIVALLQKYVVYSMDEMRELAKTDNMGFILERLSFGHFGDGDFLTPEALDRLKLMVDDIYFQYAVAFVPRIWPLLTKFNNHVYAWHSSGMDKFWEWKVTATFLDMNVQEQVQASMHPNLDIGPVELDMANFAGLLLIWLVGILSSTAAFAGELIHKHYRSSKLRRRFGQRLSLGEVSTSSTPISVETTCE